jgi:BirA family biotin operon repressor/biotin-[acetyl-CoA-carboxylase] ligase
VTKVNPLDAESIREPISAAPGARLDIIEVFSEIDSTNSYLLDQPAPPSGRFRVALADHQTAGRGRFDRSWQSPPSSGLCMSIAYTFPQIPDRLAGVTLTLGIGVVEALQRLGIDDIKLKWPNDIMALGRKLGGILTEARNDSDDRMTIVVGLGLNVDLPDSVQFSADAAFRNGIVDLKECNAHPPSRERLSIAVIESLFDCMLRFESDGLEPFQDKWRKYDWLYGKHIVVDKPDGRLSGIAMGVDGDGALVIETGGKRKRTMTGTVIVPNDPDGDA